MRGRFFAPLLALLLLSGCAMEPAEPGRQSGRLYETAGLSPDAVVLTVDGREVPAWRYLYCLTDVCDALRAEGTELSNWEAPRFGGTLEDYIEQEAVRSAALYATVESLAEEQGIALTEEERAGLSQDWATLAEQRGGEPAFLAALLDRGLERSDAERLAEDCLLYQHLLEAAREEGNPLHPTQAELDQFAQETGYFCVDFIRISTADLEPTDQETREQRHHKAERVLELLNAGADFSDLAEACSDDPQRVHFPAGRTCRPGDGTFPPEVERAAASLKQGDHSGILEGADGYYLLSARPLDQNEVFQDFFDAQLQQEAEKARLHYRRPFREISPQTFYERLLGLRPKSDL